MFSQRLRDVGHMGRAGQQGVEPTPHMNVMQNTFTFSVEDSPGCLGYCASLGGSALTLARTAHAAHLPVELNVY